MYVRNVIVKASELAGESILIRKRTTKLCIARMTAIYFSRIRTKLTVAEIAKEFNMHYTSVLYQSKRFYSGIKYGRYQEYYDNVKKEVGEVAW